MKKAKNLKKEVMKAGRELRKAKVEMGLLPRQPIHISNKFYPPNKC